LTCIVAVEHKAGVVLASDSQVSFGDTGFLLHESQQKIGFNGPYLFGCAGRLRVGQVLMNTVDLPDPPDGISGNDLNHWMVIRFSGYIQEIMKDAGIERVDDNERLMTESEIIVCVNGSAYAIDEDYACTRAGDKSKVAQGVIAIGSGYRFALGAYHALNNKRIPPEELATTMVDAAIRWDSGCGGTVRALHQPVAP
jgi:ATP-dependent protease HslVU (ClpYQ) peptidase subunit